MTAGIQAFLCAGLPRIQLSAANPQALTAFPTIATASYQLENDGDVNEIINGSSSDIGDWMSPKVSAYASFYEVRATVNSGSVTGSTTGSYIGLGTTRAWTRSQSIVGASSANLTIEIRRVGTTNVLATCTVTLDAEVT